jgi:murein DD-endopeptidase MepM/ murein hydrolase activator NlpD
LRSEDIGKESLLYGLVSGETNEVYKMRADSVVFRPTKYFESTAIAVQNETRVAPQNYVATTSGGSAIVAPTISESSGSIAARTESYVYEVAQGDTISTIASDNGISISTLLWANNLSVRSIIRPGDKFTILPVDGVIHKVKSGDTVSAIAKKYDADAEKIISFNKLGSSGDLGVGDELLIPGGKKITTVAVKRSISNVFVPAPPGKAPSKADDVASGRLVWPSDLRVITQYYGWGHTGLDVDCYFTQNNYAADDGYIQYSGWKGGYGYAVEINHGNGMITRYGHGAKNYVATGDYVSAGDPIQLCGTTGKSSGTHLHFEVIVNGKFKNPLEYLR